MALFDVKVPQLSESVAEATLLQWKKKPGEAVAQDEILIEIETDKVVLEVPAPVLLLDSCLHHHWVGFDKTPESPDTLVEVVLTGVRHAICLL